MLAIGSEKVTLGMPNVKGLYLGNGIITPVIPDENKPSGTVLHQYDRVDGKATVAGFWTDGNGQRYAVCVIDAAYRSGHQLWASSNISVDTPLSNYSSEVSVLASTESANWSMEQIKNKYTLSGYPVFDSAYSQTLTYQNDIYHGLVPNAPELQIIYNNRSQLDLLDPTLEDYPNNSLTTWNINNNSSNICWSVNEKSATDVWALNSSGIWGYYRKPTKFNTQYNYYGVIPIIEIPVDENGAVL